VSKPKEKGVDFVIYLSTKKTLTDIAKTPLSFQPIRFSSENGRLGFAYALSNLRLTKKTVTFWFWRVLEIWRVKKYTQQQFQTSWHFMTATLRTILVRTQYVYKNTIHPLCTGARSNLYKTDNHITNRTSLSLIKQLIQLDSSLYLY
jgi:hypothetical protein